MSQDACKVLVVDEDRSNANNSVMLLEIWGHEAQAAYSAEDALSKARALDPDVILIDLGRAVANGLDLASELRRCCPGAKFVAITGFTSSDIVRGTRAASFDKILVKPAPAKNLKEAVDAECAAAASKI